MARLKIQFMKVQHGAVVPEYATIGAAGMDLAACIDAPVKIHPHERAIIPTGLAVALPVGYELQIRGRSGMASKFGVMPANGIGTIDSDYRGEIGIILLNTSSEAFTVEPGMRVAQAVLARYEIAHLVEVDKLNETDRGEGGYGSTGR